MTQRELKPWERQPGESPRAWAAARTYLELGAERSLSRVGKKLGKSETLMARWSSAHGWVERAEAYDDFLREQEQDAIAKTRVAVHKRWAQRHEDQIERLYRSTEALIDKLEEMAKFPLTRV